MCGIAGFLGKPQSDDSLKIQVDGMSEGVRHRGPDSHGAWTDGRNGIALGHRRLAIIDLSPLGHQPMISSSGRYVLSLNGEIYNFLELRAQLESRGVIFKGRSDTEVVANSFDEFGIVETLKRMVGMFAFAVWDRETRKLTIARDRLGEKPLFYGLSGNSFVFASELKALTRHESWRGEIDSEAVALLLKHNYVPSPFCIYKGIKKLTPGTYLEISGEQPAQIPEPIAYWSPLDIVQSAIENPFRGSPQEAADEFEDLLTASISNQMISDVPLGAFLSGGVDSSLTVAMMQKLSNRPVKTFTIGFTEHAYNEAPFAKAVAQHLKTDHTELYISPQQAMAVIPRLSSIYDEPFSDSSQIPTILVSELARKSVTVSLSGDAGDELFAGYTRYAFAERFAKSLFSKPRFLLAGTEMLLRSMKPATWDNIFKLAPKRFKFSLMGDKLHKLADVLKSRTPTDIYDRLVSHWEKPEEIVRGVGTYEKIVNRSIPKGIQSFTETMMYIDMTNYLPDDILTKVDRAAMSIALESRVPLLDHRIVEFSWRLPLNYKFRDGVSKWPMREVLYKYVPRELIERPKMGFGIPIKEWIRGPLRDWCEPLLSPSALSETGIFEVAPIRKAWEQHTSRQSDHGYALWDILMFQDWYFNQRAAVSKKFSVAS